MRKAGTRREAFTLVEVLLVSALLALVGWGVYRSLSNGVSLWHWQYAHRCETDAELLFDRLGFDLHNLCTFDEDDRSFSGERIAFLVHEGRGEDGVLPTGPAGSAIARVSYRYDRFSGAVVREVFSYGTDVSVGRTTLLSPVLSFAFLFDVYDPIANRTDTTPDPGTVLPRAVRVFVRYREPSGRERSLEREIAIELHER